MPQSDICSVSDCPRSTKAKGLCGAHYQRLLKGADMNAPLAAYRPRRKAEGCSVGDCKNRHASRGMCATHYGRTLRGQDVEAPVGAYQRRAVGSLAERMAALTGPPLDNGCMEWLGRKEQNGYGVLDIRGKGPRLAHRLAMEQKQNVALDDFVAVHHMCANRACVNREHLQVVLPHENTAEMLERKGYRKRIAELETEVARLRAELERRGCGGNAACDQ